MLVSAAALATAACSTPREGAETGESAAAQGASAAAAPAAAPAAGGDADQATGGSGVPAGYTGRTDNASAAISGAKYVAADGRWEVTTGPAHILYRASDTASGAYTASASFEQLEAPRHPEAYGLIIGGQNLDQPTQRYTYFIARGTGEFAVKVRDGAEARDVVAFRAGEGMAKADASGRATYRLAAQVTADSVRFLVNDARVAAVAKSAVPSEGIVGLRVNHNLHIRTAPVEIKK
jgi:hypothetical protein